MLSIALMMFSGCGISESRGEEPNLPVDPEKPSDALQQEELVHLEFFDQFDWYNQSVDNSGGFVLSETEQDGGLCYKFENTDLGVTILVPPANDSAFPPVAAVFYQGNLAIPALPPKRSVQPCHSILEKLLKCPHYREPEGVVQ